MENKVKAIMNSLNAKNQQQQQHLVYSDEKIADLIAKEAAMFTTKTSLSSSSYDFINNDNDKPRVKDINKTFLGNTIRSVNSHNRREVVI